VKTLIVSGSDGKLFALLRDLIASIRDAPAGAEVAVAVLDADLDEDARAWLDARGVERYAPPWELRAPLDDPALQHLRIMDGRARLPDYFPGYDTYLWIDADAWVQDWAAIDLAVRGAAAGALAVAYETHPAYRPVLSGMRAVYLPFGLMRVRTWASRRYARFYGTRAARAYGLRPVLNSGVYALRADAPHWRHWADSMKRAIGRDRDPKYMINQIALNHAVAVHDLPVAALPAWCNWGCYRALPMADAATGRLVEPMLPHTPIGIVHRTGPTKAGRYTLATPDGGTVERDLGYPGRARQAVAQ